MEIFSIGAGRVVVFQNIIVEYWHSFGRKNLPWRNTSDPWQILIAEILLRKTTSIQALPIFKELAGYSPSKLLAVTQERLEEILQPIGLYKVRAQQMRIVAEKIASSDPIFLKDEAFLRSLPGVGRYISNAVLCFAFGIPKPALDTNMIRVLQRVFEVKSTRSRAREDRQLWEFAEMLVPADHCREYNWGVLDLAAALCKPKNPLCVQCPLMQICSWGKLT